MTKTKAQTPSSVATGPVASAPPTAVSSIKRYDETFRKSAVEHWIKTGQPGTQIAPSRVSIKPGQPQPVMPATFFWRAAHDGTGSR